MAKTLTLLHTSPVHVPRFDTLRDRIAPGQSLRHVVREDWLARARASGIDPVLANDIRTEVVGPTLCTCTTLGPISESFGALRIDRPMMEDAADLGGVIALAYCLDSTREGSLALLRDTVADRPISLHPLPLTHAWPAFEAGDQPGYAAAIANGVRVFVAAHPDTTTVVLAQASMDVALPFLADLGIPVLSPAEAAFRRALSAVQE